MARRIFDFLTSLKLTIVCLLAALVLVFAGTLAQVHLGIHIVQERYFQSIFVWWPSEGSGFKIPVFPGGHLLGAIMLINLIAAHLRRFRLNWRHLGIHLTHGGLIVMLAGGLFTDLFAVESFMRLAPGDTLNYSQDSERMELALIDARDPQFDQVTAISESRLRRGGTVEHRTLPFRVVVKHWYRNAQLDMLDQPGKGEPAADHGVGARVSVHELPRATAMNARDVKAAVVQIVPIPSPGQATAEPLGTWLVSEVLGAPQTFACGGGTWRIALRPARYYKPFSLTLQKFTHEIYAGTDIPKNFASHVTLVDAGRSVNRDATIYMNHPLRYRGETFYQSGFEKGNQATVLQVVRNPTFVAPYLGCIVIGAGLLLQFTQHFIGFLRQRKPARTL